MAKIGHHADYSLCKMGSLGQKLKMPKSCEKRFYEHFTVVCKKLLGKTPNIRKMRAFENGQKWPPRKGYSLCKMGSLGQKLNIPKGAKNDSTTTLQLWCAKKPLQKTPNVRKMRAF